MPTEKDYADLIPLTPLGDTPEITEAFRILAGEVELPPGTDSESVFARCHTVLQEAMDRALSSAECRDEAPHQHLKEKATVHRS